MANPPVHRLAIELLSHIFSFCPSSFNDFCESPSETDYRNGAVALRVSHVSRYWRTASHATPSLWRTITVISPWLERYPFAEDPLKPHAERVKHYLKLSGKLPLRIVLDDLDLDYGDDEMESDRLTVMECLICPLTSESYRWESFYGDLPGYFAVSIWELDVPMPFLTELHLKDSEYQSSLLLRTETPKLERLTIHGVMLWGIEDMPCFAPNSALHYISLGGMVLCNTAPMINAASADMAVELRDISSDIPMSAEPITCSSHTLTIKTSEGLAEILVKLKLASSVKTLEFCEASPFPLGSFKGMLSRSSSTEITNFALRSSHISDTHLLNLLAALPCLTHLTIEEPQVESPAAPRTDYLLPPPFSNAFFDVLADSEHDNDSMTFTVKYDPLLHRGGQERHLDHFGEEKPFDVSLCPLLPCLTDLVLVFHLSPITENTVKMVESRVRPASEGIAHLQFVSLHYCHPLDEKSRLGLKHLGEAEGLELDVRQDWNWM